MTKLQQESISGDLRAYLQLKPDSMLHVDELMNERRTHSDEAVREELRQNSFYTADGELYRVHGKKRTPQWAITRLSHNLVLKHLDDAFSQLTTNGIYHPDRQEADRAFCARDTKVFDLTRLRLQKDDYNEYCFLPIDTQHYDKKLNAEEQQAAQRVFGNGQNFVLNMKMLNDANIQETRIFVLNPQYIQEQVKKSPLGRASWLINFSNDSSFSAIDRDIGSNGRLRGVRREDVVRSAAPESKVSPAP